MTNSSRAGNAGVQLAGRSGTVGGSLLCESSPAGQTDSVHVSQGKLCIYNFHHFLARRAYKAWTASLFKG